MIDDENIAGMLYILPFLAAALIPLALAGYGGHLATLALPEPKKQRRAKVLVWAMAILGVALSAVSQVYLYRSDFKRDTKLAEDSAKEDSFRTGILRKLDAITNEPDIVKKNGKIEALKADLGMVSAQAPITPSPNQSPAAKKPSPSTGRTWEGEMVPLVTALMPYQTKNNFKEPLTIGYLAGNRESFFFAENLQMAYRNGGWDAEMEPRTDISYVTGLVLIQSSIELTPPGTEALRALAKASSIPLEVEEQPNKIKPDKFEIWVGDPKAIALP